MRFPKRALTLALALAVTITLGGCRDEPSSLHPVFADEALTRPALVEGRWVQGDDDALVIRASSDGHYEIEMELVGEKEPATFHLRFGRVGSELFWDLTASPDRTGLGAWPVHAPARVRVDGDTLEVAYLNGERLRQGLESGEFPIAHSIVDGGVLLTAPTPEVEAFLAANAWREDLFDEPSRFVRR